MNVTAGGTSRPPASQLSDELAALRNFVAILQQEQQTLVSGDLDRLSELVKDKTDLASQLGQYADQRTRMLTAAALSPDRAGMEKWLARLAPADPAHSAWKNLVALSTEAQALNESNGKLIAMRMQHNQQALNVLLTASNQATVYGPDGQTKSAGGGRLFGAA